MGLYTIITIGRYYYTSPPLFQFILLSSHCSVDCQYYGLMSKSLSFFAPANLEILAWLEFSLRHPSLPRSSFRTAGSYRHIGMIAVCI